MEKRYQKLTDDISMMAIGFEEIIDDEIKNIDCKEIGNLYKVDYDEVNNIRVVIVDDDSKIISMYKKLNINFSVPWAKFYQMKIIRENKIIFPNEINIGASCII